MHIVKEMLGPLETKWEMLFVDSVSLAKFAPLQCVLGHCQTPPTDFMVVPDLLESEGFLP